MTRSFTYDGSDELAGATRVASFRFTEAAYRGETGEGGFDWDDEGAAGDLVGLKPFTAEEDEATPTRMFTGFIDDRGIGRGPYKTDADRQWQVSLTDYNAILDDIVIRTSTGNRPAETDVERVTWLLTTGTLSPFSLDDSLVSASNASPMDAADYRGRHPRDVLDECAEQAGKNFWVRDDGSGPFMYYDVDTGSAYPSTASISNAGDQDGSTIFAPAWGDVPALSRDPARVYSGVRLEYGAGANVYVENPTTEAAFRRRETALFDSAAQSPAQATIIAKQFLAAASTEEDVVEVPIIMERPYVTLFRAGMKVSTNFTHLGGTKSYRIARASVEPWEEHADQYLVTLSLRVPVKITRFGGRGSAGQSGGGAGSDTLGFYSPASSCFSDYFNRTNGSAWGTASSGQTWSMAFLNGGTASVAGGKGLLTESGLAPASSESHATVGITAQTPTSIECTVVFERTPAGALQLDTFVFAAKAGSDIGFVVTLVRGDDATYARVQLDTLGDSASIYTTVWSTGPYYITVTYQAGVGVRAQVAGGAPHDLYVADATTPANLDTLIVEHFLVETGPSSLTASVDDIVINGCAPTSGQQIPLELIGTADGGTTGFFTLYPYQPGSLHVLVDGIDWTVDVTETDPTTGSFAFATAPASGDTVRTWYTRA